MWLNNQSCHGFRASRKGAAFLGLAHEICHQTCPILLSLCLLDNAAYNILTTAATLPKTSIIVISSTVLPICQLNIMYPVNSVLVLITCWAQNAEGSFNEAKRNILAVVVHLRKSSASELRSFCDGSFQNWFYHLKYEPTKALPKCPTTLPAMDPNDDRHNWKRENQQRQILLLSCFSCVQLCATP